MVSREKVGSTHTTPRRAIKLLLMVAFAAGAGCTRHYYRLGADREVGAIIAQKDRFPAWKVIDAHVYPDPRARFADPTDPDRPPKPPDDPATQSISPNPQKPGKAGEARIEGAGYLELLRQWDAENRANDRASSRTTESSQVQKSDPDKSALPPPRQAADGPDQGEGHREDSASPTAETTRSCAYRIRLDQAAELALINSREYQDRREDLYLAALPVTLQRFAFAPQFYATEVAIRRWAGSETPGGPQNFWEANTATGFSKLFPYGGLLLFNFANQTVLNLGGAKSTTSQSELTLDLMQPFLRGGGKAVTLEPLTQSERNLVYEMRSYAHFRKELFASIAAAGLLTPGAIPPPPGSSGLSPGANAGLLFPAIAHPPVTPGGSGFFSINPAIPVIPAGYLPTLLLGAELMNDRASVNLLQNFLKLFEALKEGGDVPQLQVDQVSQQLLQAESQVLTDEQNFDNALDQFKLQLGLPPNLPLELDDMPLRSLMLHFKEYNDLFTQFDRAREELSGGLPADAGEARRRVQRVLTGTAMVRQTRFRDEIGGRLAKWQAKSESELADNLRALAAQRRDLLDAKTNAEQSSRPFPAADQKRLADVTLEIDVGNLERAIRAYVLRPWQELSDPLRRHRQQAAMFQDIVSATILALDAARNERMDALRGTWPRLPRLCVPGADLLAIDPIDAQARAAQIALVNRLDLMNARAQVVDAWRQIAIFANALLGTLNVEYRLDSMTPAGLARPFDFAASRTTSQLFISGELPLIRLPERNNYRACLIAFQRQRRALMESEDLVVSNVRSLLRQLHVLAENYKIQQRQVELAYATVESSLDTFRAPPPAPAQAGQVISTTSAAVNAASLTQQLLSAQRSLPTAQNELLTVWIGYLSTRILLYRDLELMQVDPRGLWIDDFDSCNCSSTDDKADRGHAADPTIEQLPPARQVPAPR
jgi:outer membrane protein TolC